MDWLYSLLDNSSVPVVTALILGILTAVSPCPDFITILCHQIAHNDNQ